MPSITLSNYVAHYEEAGRGTPLVLLHGYPLDCRIWRAQRLGLANHWRVITPDFRGFGKSISTEPFTIESLADDVHELLAALESTRCVLGGLSMGGYVALAYVRKYLPELLGLMLIDTRAQGDTPEGKVARMKAVELVREKGAGAIADQMLPKMLAPDAAQSRPTVARELHEIMSSCPAQTIEHALLAMRDRPDQSAELPSIAVRTLILAGDGDVITPPTLAKQMQESVPNSRLAIIRGAGHMTPMEQPEQVNRALRSFLDSMQ